MQVRELMSPIAESVHPDDPLRDASEKMKALELDPMPVTEGNRLVGVLTAEGVQACAQKAGLGAGAIPARDAMSTSITSVTADESAHDALARLQPDVRDNRRARLPVVDGSDNLVGSVTVDTLRRHVEEPGEGVAAVFAVESISSLVDFDQDRVDFMSDESFPASDPIPPPSSLAPDETQTGPD